MSESFILGKMSNRILKQKREVGVIASLTEVASNMLRVNIWYLFSCLLLTQNT